MKTSLFNIIIKLQTVLTCLLLFISCKLPVYASASSSHSSRGDIPIALFALIAGIICARYYKHFIAARNKKADQFINALKKNKEKKDRKKK